MVNTVKDFIFYWMFMDAAGLYADYNPAEPAWEIAADLEEVALKFHLPPEETHAVAYAMAEALDPVEP